MQEILSYISALEDCSKKMNELRKEVSFLEGQEQDVLHYIEFNVFNASEGYKLSKELQRIRNKRREAKNSLITFARFIKGQDSTEQNIVRAVDRARNAINIEGKDKKGSEKSYQYDNINIEEVLGRK